MKSLPTVADRSPAAPVEKGTYAFVNEEANAAMNDVLPQPVNKAAKIFTLINP